MSSLALHFPAVSLTHEHRSLLETLIVTCDDTASAHRRRLSVNMCISTTGSAARRDYKPRAGSSRPSCPPRVRPEDACVLCPRPPPKTPASDLERLPWRCTVAALCCCRARKGQTHRTNLPTGANSSVIYSKPIT